MQRALSTALYLLTVHGVFSGLPSNGRGDDEIPDRETADYERDIRPLLMQKCVACHGALRQNSGLRLDAGEMIRKGGDSGPAVQPGQSVRSLLIERVTASDPGTRMPPEGQGEKLSDGQIALFRKWIDEGAVSPVDEPIPKDPAKYWSYQNPVRPSVPTVRHLSWVRTPIDAFIASEHEKRGLTPAADTSREVWLRRVFLDLIGLPPSRAERQAFLNDASESAFEKVVDNLLARPEYGERWGRHWMDVWRYSDWYGSRGINEIRYSQRHVWRWRDWIVESLNEDKPYDQMVVEMLAGDELAPSDPDVLRATGFLGRNWYKFDRNVWLFDTVEQTSQAFLALTLKCARCHDHKFDPITQEDYYHFRAFFEPHDVRTDPVGGNSETEKDATLGPVLKEGVARTFDKVTDAKTYVFQRGDSRDPDESMLMTPAVPKALGDRAVAIEPVALPPDAWYPQLRPAVAEGLISSARSKVMLAETQLETAHRDAEHAKAALAKLQSQVDRGAAEPGNNAPILHDDFQSRSEIWNVVSGNWSWQEGKLAESSVGSFATLLANAVHPRNFQARVRYRTLQPGTYRSVGFSFDYIDNGNSQDVYTSTGDASQSIQAFHRQHGQQVYPQPGIVRTTLTVGDVTTVEITVRDQQLAISLNGRHMLDYKMPVERRDGKFALWVHNGSAEFLEVDIRELVPDLNELRRQYQSAVDQTALAESRLMTARHEVTSMVARIAAERAKSFGEPEAAVREKALAASRAEREVTAARLSEELLLVEQSVAAIRALPPASASQAGLSASETAAAPGALAASGNTAASLAEAEKKLLTARQKLAEAQMAIDKADGTYTPLGETFPEFSTGRRLGLARWITAPQNPRTSRVAVNHIWLRHFGEALVPSTANFGLNGQQPSNPELLDWLATELTNNGWRMKPIHRMIVLSSVYRQSSATEPGSPTSVANAATDPNNHFLWRMNSRRMEAEVVRDSLLSVAGGLDLSRGGPEIPEAEAQSVFRRSLYFRSTPNEKAGFLEAFDAANPNECYRRQESVVPQQALALMNSRLTLDHGRTLARKLSTEAGDGDRPETRNALVTAAFESILSRSPTEAELAACQSFLERNTATVTSAHLVAFPAGGQAPQSGASEIPYLRARENLIHVLLSHNDFITIR